MYRFSVMVALLFVLAIGTPSQSADRYEDVPADLDDVRAELEELQLRVGTLSRLLDE